MKMMHPLAAAAVAAAVAILAGMAASAPANAANAGIAVAPGRAESPLKAFEPQSVEQIAASHKGKPFVVLVWSMDCEFCQHSLDVLSKARAANPGFDIVTITTDPLSDAALAQMVKKRLSGIDLLAEAWSFGGQAPERLRYAIDPRWRGEKPRSYWYDAQGQRVAYSGVITPAVIDKMR
jgi:thiol-disulfide isomerase/thioredoxin